MKDKDKIVNLSAYRQKKQIDEEFFDLFGDLDDFTEDELDEFYDDLAFGDEFDEELGERIWEQLAELEEQVLGQEQAWLASQPVGWMNPEERPYLMQKMQLAELYRSIGRYQAALRQYQQMVEVDEMDGLGCRYEIMATYILMSDFDRASDLFKHRSEYADDVMMLVPYLVGAILAGQAETARAIQVQLLNLVPEFRYFCQETVFPTDEIMAALEFEDFAHNSYHALLVAFSGLMNLLMVAHPYVQVFLNQAVQDMSESFWILSDVQQRILLENGVRTEADLAQWTERDLLALPKFGPATLRNLKEAGVRFKSK